MKARRFLVVMGAASLAFALVGPAQAQPRQWDPLAPPSDIALLVADMSRSLVQVQCGSRVATGWSLAVSLSDDAKKRGYRSMIATDLDTMSQCREGRSRNVEIRYRGGEYTGELWTWRNGQPYAGVMTRLNVPALSWARVPRPVDGQWVGSVTSDGGNGAAFQQGRVQSVGVTSLTTDLEQSSLTAGSPTFDSQGNVLGMVALQAGRPFEAGAPQLCSSIIRCRDPNSIWVIFTIPRVVRSPEAIPIKGGLRVTWQAPEGADGSGPVDYYEYRVGRGVWKKTSRTVVVIKPLPRKRATTVEIRAVNSIGPGASIVVRGTPL
jgi:hypothetical protein